MHATSDPQARQKLMQEHMESMQQHMTMMGNMAGSMPMERCMDMMRPIMDQMSQHQQMMQMGPAR
jgi:uncharacterized protein YjgD (DUF1641 family)